MTLTIFIQEGKTRKIRDYDESSSALVELDHSIVGKIKTFISENILLPSFPKARPCGGAQLKGT